MPPQVLLRGPEPVQRRVLRQILLREPEPVQRRVLQQIPLREPEPVQRRVLQQILLREPEPVQWRVLQQVLLPVSDSILRLGPARWPVQRLEQVLPQLEREPQPAQTARRLRAFQPAWEHRPFSLLHRTQRA